MHILATLTFPQRLRVERLVLEEGVVTVHASATSRCARCPMWGRSSRRVHGRYTRTLAALRDTRAKNLNASVRWRSLAGGVERLSADAERARQTEESQDHAI